MVRQFSAATLKSSSRPLVLWMQVAVLVLAVLLPVALSGDASAAQLTSRSVELSTSEPNATGVNYKFDFTLPSATAVQGIIFEFCTAPLGTCTLPTSMDLNSATMESQTFSQVTSFTIVTIDTGDCTVQTSPGDDHRVCVERTEAGLESGAKSITLGTITNPGLGANINVTVYARIYIYSDTSFSTRVHEGVVAGSVNQFLVVTGRVQERLEFCVAALVADAILPTNCGDLSTPDIDIGIIDHNSVYKAPVVNDGTNGANNSIGVAFLNTNASGGANITFIPVAASSGTEKLINFRVDGATCNVGVSFLDQCFENAADAGEVLVAGTERFGMAILCFEQNDGSRSTTGNLTFDTAAYNGDGNGDCSSYADDATAASSTSKFAWNSGSSPVSIATSSSVVDKEVVKLTFAATAATTTPTGAYSVTSMYIVTATF